MSRAGDCYDNAVAKCFFASLKRECLGRQHFATRTGAYDAIAAHIDGFYNSTCRHSTLNYQCLIDFSRASSYQRAA